MRTRMILGAIVLALVLALIGGAVIPARAEGNLQPAAQAGWFYHTVKAGETVSGIALHYGVTTQAIINLNGLPWPYTIYSGKWLKIPTATYPTHPPMPAYRYHVVKWGETVSSIALHYGVTQQAIINLNGLAWPYTIYSGKWLKIPTYTNYPPMPSYRYHIVKWGETVNSIGRWYGVTAQAIINANSLHAPYTIYTGQRLYIPSWGGPGPHPGPVMGRAYVVRPGDTLIRIGQWYGIPWGDIAWRNHLAYPYNIYVGQVLYIP